jgi:type IV pilus assembly protein PilM
MLQARDRGDKLEVVAAARIDAPLRELPSIPTQVKPSGKVVKPAPPVAAKPGDVEPDATLVEQIRSSFSAGRFSGRSCVVSLARHDVSIQSIRLPKMPDEELRQTAVWEASQRFGFDRAGMEVDFIRTGATLQGESREEVILIAAPHAAIHARLEPVLAAGLRPLHVETGFSALARAFSRQVRRESDRERVRALVEVGESGSTVMILRGDQIAFCKSFAMSGEDFNKAVAEHLQLDSLSARELRAARMSATRNVNQADNAESDASTDRAIFEAVRPLFGELIKEVMLCLRYYGVTFRGHPPEKIILTGGAGQELRLGEMLASACKTPVVFDTDTQTPGELAKGVQSALNRTPGPEGSWAVALGASLRRARSERARMDHAMRSALKEAA